MRFNKLFGQENVSNQQAGETMQNGTEHNIKALEDRVDEIIKQRKTDAVVINDHIKRANTKLDAVKQLQKQLADIAAAPSASAAKDELAYGNGVLNQLYEGLSGRVEALESLKQEFSSDYLYDGISGEAGVGKSQTLQTLTGLSDAQIPTGSGGLPITAVRTEYVNSESSVAEVTFRSPDMFMKDYVVPRFACIAEASGVQLSCETLNSFRTYNLASIDPGTENLLAYGCFLELRQAQRSLKFFGKHLTGDTQQIPLEGIASYNSYPSADEVQDENAGKTIPKRLYLAVDSIVVHCPFPGMGAARVGLIDLPGLGEATEETARTHIRDLNHRVNHITVIAATPGTRAHVTDSMRRNLQNLMSIQPGIKNRSDLIAFAVNEFTGKEDATQTLRDQITEMLNSSSVTHERYSINQYSAMDRNSVYGLFFQSYEATATKLPELDQQKIAYALQQGRDSTEIEVSLNQLQQALDKVRRAIPNPRQLTRKRIKLLSGAIVKGYTDLGVAYCKEAKAESTAFCSYKNEVQRIHDTMTTRIETGFCMGSQEAWGEHAIGQKNYYTFYLEECDRLMCEIVTAYGNLDVFYDSGLEQFKQAVADVLIDSAPNLRGVLEAQMHARGVSSVRLVNEVLAPAVNETCLSDAFSFLTELRFNFFSNVLHRIEANLGTLNPAPDRLPGAETGSPTIRRQLDNRQLSSQERVERLRSILAVLASRANDAVANALTNQRDYFNKYLSDALHFFSYHLYRYDQDAFDHGVVEAIVQEYDTALYGKDADAGKDMSLMEKISSAQDAIRIIKADAR